MEHVHWWLAGLAFTLGMVLTSTLMVRPVEHQVLVKKSVRGSSAKSKPPTARKPAVKSGTKRGVADGEDQGGNGVCCGADPGCRGARGGADPGRRRAGGAYSGGSVRAVRPGLGARWCRWQRTAGWLVKGRSDTRLYYTPEDPTYDPTVAQVWFQDEESAARAFFTPWRKSTRRT